MKAKTKMKCLQTKKHQRFPENPKKLGDKHGTDYLSEPPEETSAANTLISDFWPQNSELIHVYLF